MRYPFRGPLTLLSALALALLVAGGCSPLPAPSGLECDAIHDGSLDPREALDVASPGECVLLQSGDYEGGLTVPAGVTLAGARDAEPRLQGAFEAAFVVSLAEGAALWGVDIDGRQADGVHVLEGPAAIRDVRIRDAEVAVLASCQGASCIDEAKEILLADVEMTSSRFGLWARGARVRLDGGSSIGHDATSVTGGYGLLATQGAHLIAMATAIEENLVGILMKGPATNVDLQGVGIARNSGGGVVASAVTGSLDTPALRIADSVIEGNGIAGIDLCDSRGVIIRGTRIADTLASSIAGGAGEVVEIGDGILITGGSGDIRIQDSGVEENARVQIMVHAGGEGIELVDTTVTAGAAGHVIVVQETPTPPTFPEEFSDRVEYDLGLGVRVTCDPATD